MNSLFEKIEITDLRPIRDIVFERLRMAIIGGSLEKGERLVETFIAENMGVSRTPVREAFRQLEVEGLAENIPRRGTVVKGISKKDVIEIYQIREMLEGLEFRLASNNISELQIIQLKEIISKMEKSIINDDMTEYCRLHEEFHKIVLYSCGNSRLIDQMKQIYEYLSRIREATLVMNKRSRKDMVEHKEIIDVLEKRDEMLAERIGRYHTRKCKELSCKFL